MQREEVLRKLEELIPSFQRKWNGYGGNLNDEKYGFLYHDEYLYNRLPNGKTISGSLPFKIPKGFLEGIVIENADKTEKLVSAESRKKDGKIQIGMHITSFAGYSAYEHTYGTLRIPGPHWVTPGTNMRSAGYMGTFTLDPNFDPRVQDWEVELCRIITEDDINSRADWDGWEAGNANQRFVSISEMFLTACWVCLARIEAPFILKGEESYIEDDSKNLISVDENDNVTFHEFFWNNVSPAAWKKFGRNE